MDFGGGDEIRFERTGKAGIVTLARPKALNTLTHRMVKALSAALIDKGSVPNWQPPRLEDVRPEAIDAFFAPLPEGDLQL